MEDTLEGLEKETQKCLDEMEAIRKKLESIRQRRDALLQADQTVRLAKATGKNPNTVRMN